MGSEITSIDATKLKNAFSRSETSKAFLKFLNERKRNTPTLDLRRTYMEIMRKGAGLDYFDLVANCKTLESLGVGTYFKGGEINHDTFTWKYSLKLITEAANSGKVGHIPKIIEQHGEELKRRSFERGEQIRLEKEASKADVKSSAKLSLVKSAASNNKKIGHSVETKTFHVFVRPGFIVELILPTDLSSEEAANLCNSINHLAQ